MSFLKKKGVGGGSPGQISKSTMIIFCNSICGGLGWGSPGQISKSTMILFYQKNVKICTQLKVICHFWRKRGWVGGLLGKFRKVPWYFFVIQFAEGWGGWSISKFSKSQHMFHQKSTWLVIWEWVTYYWFKQLLI